MKTILKVDGLYKSFAKNKVLADVNFSLAPGEAVALVGANGAGKSTLIKIILNLVLQDKGDIELFERDHKVVKSKQKVGYLPEVSGFWEELTAYQLLNYIGKNKGLKKDDIKKRSDIILKALGLFKRGHGLMGTYSKGMLQRTGVAQALINDPDLLILDEPMSGLDPRAQEKLRTILKDLNKIGKTLLISSHSLEDVRRLCDRVLVLERSKLIEDGPTEKVLKKLTDRYNSSEPWDEDPLGEWRGHIS